MEFKYSLKKLLKGGSSFLFKSISFLLGCDANEYSTNFNGKQKVVINVTMQDAKRRSKALKIAVGMHGVMSAQIDGEKLVVIGDGIDSVALTLMLRKEMSFAKLESVSAVEEKKVEKKPEDGANNSDQQKIWPYHYPVAPQPYVYVLN